MFRTPHPICCLCFFRSILPRFAGIRRFLKRGFWFFPLVHHVRYHKQARSWEALSPHCPAGVASCPIWRKRKKIPVAHDMKDVAQNFMFFLDTNGRCIISQLIHSHLLSCQNSAFTWVSHFHQCRLKPVSSAETFDCWLNSFPLQTKARC